jgi:hypothetical protein
MEIEKTKKSLIKDKQSHGLSLRSHNLRDTEKAEFNPLTQNKLIFGETICSKDEKIDKSNFIQLNSKGLKPRILEK